MSVTISNATIRIGATAEDVAKGTAAAISHMRQFAAEAAAVLGGIRLFRFAYEANDDIAKARIAFEVMLKDVKKADDLMKGLFRFERDTPAKITELASAARQLLTAGFALEDIPAMMRVLGDAAASTGQNFEESMKRITASLAGAQARGWFTGEEIRELQRQVIPAVRYMAEAMSAELKRPVSEGEIVKMYEDKMISTSKAVRAILAGLERDRGGMMKRQANELFSGIFSTMKSQGEIFADGFIRGFDNVMKVREGLHGIRDTLVDIASRAYNIGKAFAESDGFQLTLRSLKTAGTIISTSFSVADTAVRSFLTSMGLTRGIISNTATDYTKLKDIVLDFFHVTTLAAEVAAHGISTSIDIFKLGIAGFWAFGNWGATKIMELTGDEEGLKNAEKNRQQGREFMEKALGDINPETLKRRMMAVDEAFNGLRKQVREDEKPKGALFKWIMSGADKVLYDMAGFGKQVKDLLLPEKEWNDSKIRDFFKDMGREMELNALTPIEKLKKELSDLEDIFAMGLINAAQFDAEATNLLMKADRGVKKDRNDPQVADAIAAGSAEARRITIAAIQGQGEKSVPDLLTKLNETSKQQLKRADELLRAFQAGGLVLVP